MKIHYHPARLKSNLRSSLLSCVVGACIIITAYSLGADSHSVLRSVGGGVLGAGVATLLLYFYEKQYHYLIIENNTIRKGRPWASRIALTDITGVKKFAGDYTLITPRRKMTIDTQIIDPQSLKKLDEVLEKTQAQQGVSTHH